jgi:hypothetical protein
MALDMLPRHVKTRNKCGNRGEARSNAIPEDKIQQFHFVKQTQPLKLPT